MLLEWNVISIIIALLFVTPIPVILSDPADTIIDFIDSNDNDIPLLLQNNNITKINLPYLHTIANASIPITSTAITIITTSTTTTDIMMRLIKNKNMIKYRSGTLSQQSTKNNLITHERRKKITTRNSKRNVLTKANRTTVSETCKQVMAICNDETNPMIPICDNMNQTFRSPCSLALYNCKRINLDQSHFRILVHIGPCNMHSPVFTFQKEVCPSKCSRKNRPVCDVKQKTYRNLCTFQKQNCLARKNDETNASFLYALTACNQSMEQDEKPKIKEQIVCAEPKNCDGLQQPVCDSNGNWHKNQCSFLHAQCIAVQNGQGFLTLVDDEFCSNKNEKKSTKKAPHRCIRQCAENLPYEPICATNFATYPNRCLFQKAKCRDKNLNKLYYGECRDCLALNCNATTKTMVEEDELDSNFVCDQAGRTKRKCEFEFLRCIYERKYGYNITAAYIGRCCPTMETCEQLSSKSDKTELKSHGPVCDSENVTHSSRCLFEVHKCRAEKVLHRKITLVNENGSCSATSYRNVENLFHDINVAMNHCNNSVECDNNYEPICGTDGITYVNRCRLIRTRCHNKSLLPAYNGECCINRCEKYWAPVCDDHNVTHLNLCMFNLQNCIATRRNNKQSLNVISYTICLNDSCNMQCMPNDFQPVCASNGITYHSECELNNAICTLKRLEFMGNEEKSLELDYIGECCEQSTAKCDKDDNFSSICDSEGQTHENICEYERKACLSRKRFRTNLTIRYWGECCTDDCQNEPESGMSAICDNTQKTHDSWCKFRLAQCEAYRYNNHTLQVAYMGECCKISNTEYCSNSGPICDTDNTTHNNLCTFHYKQCIMNRTEQKLINIAYFVSFCNKFFGECCTNDNSCNNDDREETCDQYGTIYPNRCLFNSKKCLLEKKSNATLILTACQKNLQL